MEHGLIDTQSLRQMTRWNDGLSLVAHAQRGGIWHPAYYEDGSIRRHALSTKEQGRRTIVGSTGSAVHYSNNLWLPSTRTFVIN